MSKNYFLLFKTADAEKRAWKNLDDTRKKAVFPIVELTRGRKNRGAGKDKNGKSLTAEYLRDKKGIYGFESNWRSALELMNPCKEIFLDLTREPSLSCRETDDLNESKNGYSDWTDYLIDTKSEWPNVLPTMIVNPDEDEDEETYKSNIKLQFTVLAANFHKIAYRVSVLEDTEFLYDLDLLSNEIDNFVRDGGRFFVVLDHEYIRSRNGQVHAKRTSQIITTIKDTSPSVDVVCLATSFPKSVTDIGDEVSDTFPVEELYLFEKIQEDHSDIHYGDYGSINPIRNDEIIIAQGWIPRIDYTSNYEGVAIYYFREKRKVLSVDPVTNKKIRAPYSIHYQSVALHVRSHDHYIDLNDSWGCGEIKAASIGNVRSNSPSHWISVRMEIHIIQLLKHFGLDPI